MLNRRDFIKLGIIQGLGLSIGFPSNLPAVANDLQPIPTAKSVIQIWMWGGPSHIDMFDPKPDAGYDYTGPLNKAIKTKIDGIRLNATLPLTAQHADKYSIIRSMTHGVNGHETASYMVQTGQKPGRLVYPSVGAVVSLFKGYDHGYQGVVPPYIVLTKPQGRFSEAGFLGSRYKPFLTGGNPVETPFLVDGIVAEGMTDERQISRKKLLYDLDLLGNTMSENNAFELLNQTEKQAWEIMFGRAKSVFDLTREKINTRERYGSNTFGQSCLMARRLVQEGVPYITINYEGWDTHKQHFNIMNQKLPEFDKGFSALLEDLSQRGLLDSTIIWCGGEFGRGPKVQWESPWNGGRSHHGACFSTVIAGGGFKGGQVIGSSDEKGIHVAERPVKPSHLIAGIYHKLGINPNSTLNNRMGLNSNVRPTPETHDVISEIM